MISGNAPVCGQGSSGWALPSRLAEVLGVAPAMPWTQQEIPLGPEVESAPPDELFVEPLLPFFPRQYGEFVQFVLKFQALLG